MKLPTLPRVIKKHESDFAEGIFARWLRDNPRISTAFEAKSTRGKNSLDFSEVTQDQISWGMAIKSDKGALVRVQGLSGQPDYVWCRNMPSYVVIRYPRMFVAIDIESFWQESKRSTRRSLTAARARELSITSVDI